MSNKAAISLTTGLEDAEKVTVAFLVAVGAAESGRPTLMFLTKEAVRLALAGTAVGTACDGCPSIPDLMARYAAADGGEGPSEEEAFLGGRQLRRVVALALLECPGRLKGRELCGVAGPFDDPGARRLDERCGDVELLDVDEPS